MKTKHVFEYATIRVVPRVERGEFVNVGVVVYSKHLHLLKAKMALNPERILSLFPEADIADIQNHLQAFEHICMGHLPAGPIAALDLPSRFRWLTAKRSTIIQASELHPGLCENAEETLALLFQQMVS
jgi:hypothetical protein